MSSQLIDVGENHAPCHIRGPAPQLASDKVAEATGAEAEGYEGCNEIHDLEEFFLDAARIQKECRQHTEQAAMKRHASFPDPQQPYWIGEEAVEIVEQHRAHAPAENRTQCSVEHQVGYLLCCPCTGLLLCTD